MLPQMLLPHSKPWRALMCHHGDLERRSYWTGGTFGFACFGVRQLRSTWFSRSLGGYYQRPTYTQYILPFCATRPMQMLPVVCTHDSFGSSSVVLSMQRGQTLPLRRSMRGPKLLLISTVQLQDYPGIDAAKWGIPMLIRELSLSKRECCNRKS